MTRALHLSLRGQNTASPNPLVGCVVAHGLRVISEGFHAHYGGPHAEEVALKKAGRRAQGATLYVTLEPCAHWGKRPPCVQNVIRSGVKEVVIATLDPHKLVQGRGIRALRAAGIKVKLGVQNEAARFINRSFFKVHTRGLPYVTAKIAQSLDGKIASFSGKSRWITGPEARDVGHRLRAQSDAVMVGAGTVRQDNPGLTSYNKGPDPAKIIVSRSLRLPPAAKVFQGAPAWVLTAVRAPQKRQKALEKRGINLLKYFMRDYLMFSMKDLLKIGFNKLFVEGGGELIYSMMSAGLIDEIYHFSASLFLGGKAAPSSVAGRGWPTPDAAPRLYGVTPIPLGTHHNDHLIHGFLNPDLAALSRSINPALPRFLI
jgi:diaminohydroxyphosphoribosylaminopyrimidine deaminase/5-amino-6-(5-phosphoribosylamino)uracil reductase